jgi:hypothetical protein
VRIGEMCGTTVDSAHRLRKPFRLMGDYGLCANSMRIMLEVGGRVSDLADALMRRGAVVAW